MPLRYVTLIVMGVVLIGVVVYDSIVAARDSSATISAITARWALRHTISVVCVALALGIILGHLFWWQQVCP